MLQKTVDAQMPSSKTNYFLQSIQKVFGLYGV